MLPVYIYMLVIRFTIIKKITLIKQENPNQTLKLKLKNPPTPPRNHESSQWCNTYRTLPHLVSHPQRQHDYI